MAGPECSQPQIMHIERAIPPDELAAHVFTDRTYTKTERYVEYRAARVPTSLIEVMSGVLRVDGVVATSIDWKRFCPWAVPVGTITNLCA